MLVEKDQPCWFACLHPCIRLRRRAALCLASWRHTVILEGTCRWRFRASTTVCVHVRLSGLACVAKVWLWSDLGLHHVLPQRSRPLSLRVSPLHRQVQGFVTRPHVDIPMFPGPAPQSESRVANQREQRGRGVLVSRTGSQDRT